MKTVSLEIAKQLKEAGFPQKSDMIWLNIDDEIELLHISKIFKPHLPLHTISYAAPTAEDILDLLPERITHRRCLYMTPTAEELLPDENNYYVFYEKASTLGEETGNPEFGGKTLVEALAKMWIYLNENDFLEKEYGGTLSDMDDIS